MEEKWVTMAKGFWYLIGNCKEEYYSVFDVNALFFIKKEHAVAINN